MEFNLFQSFDKIPIYAAERFSVFLYIQCKFIVNSDHDDWLVNLTPLDNPANVKDTAILGPNFNINKPISKSSIIDTIKNLEFGLTRTGIEDAEKDEIRKTKCDDFEKYYRRNLHISYEDRLFAKKSRKTSNFFQNNLDVFFTRAD